MIDYVLVLLSSLGVFVAVEAVDASDQKPDDLRKMPFY